MAKKTRKSAAKRKKQQQQQLLFIGAGVVVVLIAIGVVIFILNQNEADACQIDDTECFGAYAGIPLAEDSEADRDIELASDVEEGVVRGVTEDGIPYIGDPDSRIVVAEFSDFACRFCAEFSPNVDRLVREFVRPGDVRFEYYPLTGTGGARSRTVTRAAMCAADQGAFWEFHKEVFKIQEEEGVSAFEEERMIDLTEAMDLDEGEMESCMNTNRESLTLTTASVVANENNVRATPVLIYSIDGGNTWQAFQVTNDAEQRPTATSYSRIQSVLQSLVGTEEQASTQ